MKTTTKTNLHEIKQKLPKAKKEEYQQNNWLFQFQKGGIAPSDELDMLQDNLLLNAIPDVVYNENYAKILNPENDFCLEILPKDSLLLSNFKFRINAYLDLTKNLQKYEEVNNITIFPKEVKVKYSEEWQQKNSNKQTNVEIKTIQQISDVFFSTPYKGTIKKYSILSDIQKNHSYLKDLLSVSYQFNIQKEQLQFPYAEKTNDEIPLENLTEKNQIKWANMINLWEDELGDTGYTSSEFRFRVMGDCFFGLLRHYLRVDDVIIRIYDTRYYHDFTWNYILREFQVREDTYKNIKSKGFEFTPQWNLDQGNFYYLQFVFFLFQDNLMLFTNFWMLFQLKERKFILNDIYLFLFIYYLNYMEVFFSIDIYFLKKKTFVLFYFFYLVNQNIQ
ncbi:tip41-like family protein, putative [Ichthyophthirius multifiliis]|uniref:Tip41-like family protein, putative n=1 Tax=Ichthyophthirius multifiliis TaxID=5932 RepID=G0QMI0_ICHMU|nr:tip41-like family protein, putative [Ichthyophthirius multifiliis]EGR33576.1 tip41-like family protein, putative [Ichthyophthirius multifiliis]|eukprot:XP_004037562.1 tip41-like family protein, putative [Ichthyophthirius multifiliis]